jgi:uncharacterized protein
MEDGQRQLIADSLFHQHLAVVGASLRTRDFSHRLFQDSLERRYGLIRVNPGTPEIEGRPCYKRASEIQPPPKAALLMTSKDVTAGVIADLADAGVGLVWMYGTAGQGSVNDATMGMCQNRGLRVIAGQCPFRFFPKLGFPHRIHS